MPVQQLAIGPEHHHAVVERGTAEARVALVHAAHHRHGVLARGLGQRPQDLAVDRDGLRQQGGVQLLAELRVGTGPQAPDPGRVARQVGLGKDDQPCALARRFAKRRKRARQRRGQVEQHGRALDDHDAELAHGAASLSGASL